MCLLPRRPRGSLGLLLFSRALPVLSLAMAKPKAPGNVTELLLLEEGLRTMSNGPQRHVYKLTRCVRHLS